MKRIMVVMCIWLATQVTLAQEFKVAKSTGRLELNIGRVAVEGHNGNEIIFSSTDHRESKDDRAQGLRAINGSGLEDNTGLGINVTQKGDVVEVNQLKKMNAPDIKVLVPKGVIVAFSHQSQYGGKASFKNLENEIEVSATYNSIELENVTGPLAIKSVYGHIEASLGGTIKGPISIVSVYDYVDVALSPATKANLKLSTSYGEIFVGPEFNIEIDKQGEWVKYDDRVNGKLNGGGLSMDLRSDYGKIYLRKK
jgi:Putative adhesin